MAKGAQHAREGGGGSPQSAATASERVHGVREPTRQYGSPEDSLEGQGEPGPVGATRYFDTAEGRLTYLELPCAPELSRHLGDAREEDKRPRLSRSVGGVGPLE